MQQPYDPEVFTADPWLSETMQMKCFSVAAKRFLHRFPSMSEQDLAGLFELERVFLFTKVPTSDVTTTKSLQATGFRLIDTQLVFTKAISQAADAAPPRVRRVKPEDEEAVATIAAASFSSSRFHLDPSIEDSVADHIKATWVRNYFRGNRGDDMLVAVDNGAPAGFLLLLDAGKGILVIDLIAVAPNHYKKGVGSMMIQAAESMHKEFAHIQAGTQVCNIASIGLYEKLGFRLQASHYILHLHLTP